MAIVVMVRASHAATHIERAGYDRLSELIGAYMRAVAAPEGAGQDCGTSG